MHPHTARLLDLTILHVTPDEGVQARLQRHDHWELVYVARGAYRVQTFGLDLIGQAESWFCFPPRQTHRPFPRQPDGQPSELILLQWDHVPPADVDPSRDDPPALSYPLHGRDPSRRIFHALTWLYDLTHRRDDGTQVGTGDLLTLILRELPHTDAEPSFLLQSVHTYVTDHLSETIRVADLAAAVGLSPYHFARRFTQVAGLTPMRYVMTLRLKRAARLLTDTDLPLHAIAHRTGFSSAGHLGSRFHETHGIAPGKYRKSHHSD